MAWQAIHQGRYVDWGQPDPLRGLDPYLVWADGCSFTPYGGPPPGGRLATIIELLPGKSVADLIANAGGSLREHDIPAVYRMPGARCRFITAWPAVGFFDRLRTTLASVVARAEISLPVIPQRPRYRPLVPPSCGGPVARGVQRKRLIGVIDDGSAFAHYHLRDSAGHTRVRRIWDQDQHGAFQRQGREPIDFGRGHEADGAQLQALIDRFTNGIAVAEDACYEAAGYDRLRRAATHGTHVTDVAAGLMPVGSRVGTATAPPSWAIPHDAASADDTGIVFVQLPRACLQDPSGGWLDVQILDAIHYILTCADAATQEVVINLSFGPQRGPNNGTGMLESAFAELIAQHANLNLTITLAAGNSFSSRGHAVLPFEGGYTKELHWHVMPGDETPSFLQLWLPPAGSGIEVQLTPPAQAASPWIRAGNAQVWPSAARPACGVIFPPSTSRGLNGTVVLVALQPSTTVGGPAAVAPHGLWKLQLRNTAPGAADPVLAWIDRDDFNLGTLLRGRQSNFVDPLHDPMKHLSSSADDVHSDALVRRRGTLTGIATGTTTLVAAGYRYSDGKHAHYSSAGPTRGGRVGPDCAAVTDQSRTLPGLLAAGTRGGSVVRLIGTSVAAPELARWVADGRPPPGPVPPPIPDPQLEGRGLLPLF